MDFNENTSNICSSCNRLIETDNFLTCEQCQCSIHIKCLRRASTPGDLLGDVFFDFTCGKCVKNAPSVLDTYDGPSTSSASNTPEEQLKRQKLPWLLVITLALHNLSIKSSGLSHHGYFHWRTHIVSFIEKNWNYLFDPTARRRKKWIGSVSGCLSHNSPEFFVSGQEIFNETGWWKLRYANQTPNAISKLYGMFSRKRQQLRNDRRFEDNTVTTTNLNTFEPKRIRLLDSDEEILPNDSCSRTIPYMGRKPKIAKPLNIIDVDVNKTIQQQQHHDHHQQHQPLNTVQSSLMDFLAENLASDDLMFHDLPNIAPEPIIGLGKNDDLLSPLIDSYNQPKNIENSLFDMQNIKQEVFDSTASEGAVTEDVDGKLKSFYLYQEQQQQQHMSIHRHENDSFSENVSTVSTNESNDLNDDYDDEDDEYKPRIIQVTNFQQKENEKSSISQNTSPIKIATKIKKERASDAEQTDGEDIMKNVSNNQNTQQHGIDNDDSDSLSSDDKNILCPCKESLFTKRTPRPWPWLIQTNLERDSENVAENSDKDLDNNGESVSLMSVYEEKELLHKLQKIFAQERKYEIVIPAYVRRFYRKLCVREWKREHSKPIFNIDDYCDPKRNLTKCDNSQIKVLDRYQLLTSSTTDSRSSFFTRIAGSFQYELFESPYTQRILHPFIYKNTKCFPPWLKLMCEAQYDVNGTLPTRGTIDFCYVRPNHIAAVNALLQTLFWPGIDMSECLSYPDFSVVALYKKLVIGCGFLVPDVGFNEAYISFMAVRPNWQRSGIATFMLYHLIQTCMGKDITLHVSATNPAVVLYQKFGFKIEEVILDFYEKYLPIDSKHSRHAFFLRLMR